MFRQFHNVCSDCGERYSNITPHKCATLYQELKAAGFELDKRESDLYVLDTPEARAIITKPRHKTLGQNMTSFICQRDGRRWLEVPFAYDPFWEAKERLIDEHYKSKES